MIEVIHDTYTLPTYFHNVSCDILVKGKPIKQYIVKDKLYIEGRKGSEYSIRVKNTNSTPVLAIISVDGLSVIDGKPASEKSKGWIVNAYGEIDIPGWLVNDKKAAKFEFEGKSDSFAQQSGKDANNVGVIGIMIFEKQPEKYTTKTVYRDSWHDNNWGWPSWGTGGSAGDPHFGPSYICNATLSGSSIPEGPGGSAAGGMGSAGSVNSFTTSSMSSNSLGGGEKLSAKGPLGQSNGILRSCSMSDKKHMADIPEKLGTGFGEATDFKTTSEEFNRGKMIGTTVFYYDSRKNLEKLGVVFKSKRDDVQPNPFPASEGFCTPPGGWHGNSDMWHDGGSRGRKRGRH